MKSVKFKDANVTFAENQDEYNQLPALRLYDKNDTIITCVGLSFKERLKVLFTGRIWMSEMNFRRALTPRFFSVDQDEVYTKE